jgi:hypothetical protein
MSKIHYFQRYSSVENTVTNNTLQLIARIYEYSPIQASKLLNEITGANVEIGIAIQQQTRHKDSVPDGLITQQGFKILIEAKVDAAIDTDQLVRHARSFSNESVKILLLLTKQSISKTLIQETKRAICKVDDTVLFCNVTYQRICRSVQGLFKEYEHEIVSLVEDYVEYCNDSHLYDQSSYLMRVLPCSDTYVLNKEYGIYFQPSDRNCTDHAFVGIYANKSVQSIWQIESVYDVAWNGTSLKKNFVSGVDSGSKYDQKIIAIIEAARNECGYKVSDGCRFYCGEPFETDFKKTSPGGIQGARFFNLKDVIGDFSDAEEAANLLSFKTWE